METSNQVHEALDGFKLPGELKECIRYGSGHINDTYRLTYETPQGTKRYILQRMSTSIFKKPVELMENVSGVTAWLRKKIIENGGDPERETLTLVKSNDGLPYFVDSAGEYWRVYLFIEGATCYDAVKDDNDFYQSAVAFGHFQRLLADYPAETLHETIKDFHNTPDRLEKFKKAVAEDICGRAASVQKEIDFILEREEKWGLRLDFWSFDDSDYWSYNTISTGAVDEDILSGFLKENNVTPEEFLTNKRYIVIQNGDESNYWQDIKDTGLINMDMIESEYPTDEDYIRGAK